MNLEEPKRVASRHVGEEEVANFEATQRGKRVKTFKEVLHDIEYFYLYENYRSNLCTNRCLKTYPQCDINSRKEFNSKCWNGGLFPSLKNYCPETFVLVD